MTEKNEEQLDVNAEVNAEQNDISVFENEKHQIVEEKDAKLKADIQASHSKEPQKNGTLFTLIQVTKTRLK